MAFVQKACGAEARAKAIGASDDEISLFASLCRFPLPTLYVEYLRAFGRNDPLKLTDDADSRIGELIDFYRMQAQENYAQVPPKTVIIGLEVLSGGRGLCYAQVSEPIVVATWDGQAGAIQAKSFRNYLYSQTFQGSRFPVGKDFGSLHGNDKCATASLTAFAVTKAFEAYWFCDAYQACLERGDDFLFISQVEDGTSVFLNCASTPENDNLVKEFTRSFQLQDTSQLVRCRLSLCPRCHTCTLTPRSP